MNIAHLETIVTFQCDTSCVACDQFVVPWRAMVGGPPSTTPEIVQHDLAHLAPVLHTDRWAAMGGEPTLHRSLVDILDVVRESRIADALELWTNGHAIQSADRRLGSRFWSSFDILIVSVYPGKHTPESLAWIEAKCRDTGRRLEYRNEVTGQNFRNILDPRGETGPAETADKWAKCFFRKFCRGVSWGSFTTCCCAPSLGHTLMGRPRGEDGIPVEGITAEKIRAYLERKEPLVACRVCAGRDTSANAPLAWSEERDPVKWVTKSQGKDLS